jgi:hypothetical protein
VVLVLPLIFPPFIVNVPELCILTRLAVLLDLPLNVTLSSSVSVTPLFIVNRLPSDVSCTVRSAPSAISVMSTVLPEYESVCGPLVSFAPSTI